MSGKMYLQNVNVTHPDTVVSGFSQLPVSVTYTGSGLPVANAEICISGNGVFALGTTDVNGFAMIDIDPSSLDQLNITVRGGTVIPYEGTIQVVQGVENVALFGDPVITDLDGNLDGLINPNENGTITFTLKNYGTQTSPDVFATLTELDTMNYVQIITTDPVSFGNIVSGSICYGNSFPIFC